MVGIQQQHCEIMGSWHEEPDLFTHAVDDL